MRRALPMFAVLSTLIVTSPGLAASEPGQPPPDTRPDDDHATRHAVRGVVASVSESSLVVARPGRERGELTFVLTASTDREGTLVRGATVSVRYRREGDLLIATAAIVHAAPRAASALQKSG